MVWPEAFVQRIRSQFGSEAEVLLESLSREATTSVLLNPAKHSARFPDEQVVPWNSSGRLLKKRPSFTADPLLHAGAYYVQESSSMFVEYAARHLLQDHPDPYVLDLCAAPGGKSLNLLNALGGKGLLVSNELIRPRNAVLRENLCKWGASNTVVTQNDPSAFSFLSGFFDLVLVDAPCSGEGLFRRDPLAAESWSPENVMLCAGRQRRILAEVIPALRAGGHLLYSTCTWSPQENEANLEWLATQENMKPVELPVDATWDLEQVGSGLRFLPHRVAGEGFFISAWQKVSGDGARTKLKETGWYRRPTRQERVALDPWFSSGEVAAVVDGHSTIWLNTASAPVLNTLTAALHITATGLEVGSIKHGALVPGHGLAMSPSMSQNIPQLHVSLDEALTYLRMDPLPFGDYPPGWSVVRFEGMALGWTKGLDRRINNYYPKEWRIRSRHV